MIGASMVVHLIVIMGERSRRRAKACLRSAQASQPPAQGKT